MESVRLKKGKEKAVRQRHHWIFSGAVEKMPEIHPGQILKVESYEGEMLGTGYFNPQSNLIGRMISFGQNSYQEELVASLKKAIELRKGFFNEQKTNAWRLINGEGDALPGLIVDRYADFLVIQIGTQGMELLKPWLIEKLTGLFPCRGIYEKSVLATRKEEGLAPFEGIIYGEVPQDIQILEEGIQFFVNPREGQKTGFFLDQREMRKWVRELSYQKRVLNCFSYSGGFSLYALAGGCQSVDSVDISQKALSLAQKNIALNGFSTSNCPLHCADVFDFLRTNPLDYDLVILDPPAFAKKKHEVINACRGYKEINRVAIQKMPPKSLLITCSCSYHVEEKLFQQLLFQAALEARRTVKIIGKHRLAFDHPINIYHPEIDYLKSFLLYIE